MSRPMPSMPVDSAKLLSVGLTRNLAVKTGSEAACIEHGEG
jgi:hypothetical protein